MNSNSRRSNNGKCVIQTEQPHEVPKIGETSGTDRNRFEEKKVFKKLRKLDASDSEFVCFNEARQDSAPDVIGS